MQGIIGEIRYGYRSKQARLTEKITQMRGQIQGFFGQRLWGLNQPLQTFRKATAYVMKFQTLDTGKEHDCYATGQVGITKI